MPQSSPSRTSAWLFAAADLAGAGLLLILLGYAARNTSGHTGLNPLWTLPGFAMLLIASAWNLGTVRPPRPAAVVGFVTGLWGAALAPVLVATGLLQDYEVWCAGGMEPPPSWRLPFVLGYGATFGIALALGLHLAAKKKRAAAPGT